jgi:NAD(P)-dependent dehydrogenase (short-subunit alcohol dehydrogenase family)
MLSAYRVNVVGPLLVNQTFLPTLNRGAAPPGPVVVNMSPAVASLYDKVARGVTPYRCSKVALNMMNVNFAREVPDVIWLALHPGWVDTEMGRNFGPKPSMKPEQSAAAILKTVSKVTKEDSGFFVDYSGKKLPF